MKKLQPRRLMLDRATIRVLDDRAIEQVIGGDYAPIRMSVRAACCSKLASGCSAGMP
jgi:hypothetical protein